jgi:hypothetical protein
MIAAEHSIILLGAVPDYSTAAGLTHWRHHVNGAFKTVEGVRLSILGDGEGAVVFIATAITLGHFQYLLKGIESKAAVFGSSASPSGAVPNRTRREGWLSRTGASCRALKR